MTICGKFPEEGSCRELAHFVHTPAVFNDRLDSLFHRIKKGMRDKSGIDFEDCTEEGLLVAWRRRPNYVPWAKAFF